MLRRLCSIRPNGRGKRRATAPIMARKFAPTPRPYTSGGRTIATSIPESIANWRKPASASCLEIPYASCGAGASSTRKGLPTAVASPFTLIELTKTKRLTPAAAACRAKFKVPSTFTERNALSGSSAVSCITCTRAAQWTTARVPRSASLQSVPLDKSPTARCSIEAGRRRLCCRTPATISNEAIDIAPALETPDEPVVINRRISSLPTKPVAPVTRTLTRPPLPTPAWFWQQQAPARTLVRP
ncbi:hypothetical protein PMI12_03750 [Variovorax sp. CF313]|nr:hypothetical protein PMI12_03750 [Variovorax sp. CF313]